MIAHSLFPQPAETYRPALTNDVAVKYLPKIRRHATRIARRLPRHVQVGDLMSAGFMGLIDAFMKYDTDRMDSFDAYVDHRIRGAILDELRVHDPLTRDQRIFARRLSAARQSAANETGYAPNEQDVAKVLGLPLATYRTQVERMTALSARNEAGVYDEDVVDTVEPTDDQPDVLAEQSERRQRISAAVHTLPRKLQTLIRMFYEEGKTMREIGEHLGVTESRVSQLHSEAVAQLRGVLSPD